MTRPLRTGFIRRAVRLAACASACSTGALLHGCASPESVTSFESNDPAARLRAVRQAAATRDSASVPKLIQLLSSSDPAERFMSIQALESITGQRLGYDHAAAPELREQAAKRWAEWYSLEAGRGSGLSNADSAAPGASAQP